MLQELAARTGNTALVIFVMIVAIVVFGLVVWRLVRKSDAEAKAQARLPLEGDPPRRVGEVDDESADDEAADDEAADDARDDEAEADRAEAPGADEGDGDTPPR